MNAAPASVSCAHPTAIEIPPQPVMSETYVRWCPNCGAINDNNGDHGAEAGGWRLPATPGAVPSPYDLEQLRVQLAGCLTAAEGGIGADVEAKEGAFGWSIAYAKVVELRRKYEALLESWQRTRSQKGALKPTPGGQKLPSATPIDTAEMRKLGRVGRYPLEERVLLLCDEIDRLVADVRVLGSQLETMPPEGTAPVSVRAALDATFPGLSEAAPGLVARIEAEVAAGPTLWDPFRSAVESFLRTHDIKWARCLCCDERHQPGRCEGTWCATYGESFAELDVFAEIEAAPDLHGVDDFLRKRAERGEPIAHVALTGQS